MAQKVEAQGGKGGKIWDDGSEHDAVTKIHVGAAVHGIQFVQFSYLNKNGETKETLYGSYTSLCQTTRIKHPEEYLVSVDGWYNPEGVIEGLRFNLNTDKDPRGHIGKKLGTPFTLQVQDKKIIGFHGFAGDYVDSLGAYFAPLTSTPLTPAEKLPAVLGTGESSDKGTKWDDGAYVGVKRVYVGQAQEGISAVKFVYDKGPKEVVEEHGESTMLGFEEFKLDYPSEYITEVEGTYDTTYESNGTVINMLKFKTNKRTSKPYGLVEAGTPFSLKKEGSKIVGFHGSVGALLRSFGVHVLPISN